MENGWVHFTNSRYLRTRDSLLVEVVMSFNPNSATKKYSTVRYSNIVSLRPSPRKMICVCFGRTKFWFLCVLVTATVTKLNPSMYEIAVKFMINSLVFCKKRRNALPRCKLKEKLCRARKGIMHRMVTRC
jgi:hypothetical protein